MPLSQRRKERSRWSSTRRPSTGSSGCASLGEALGLSAATGGREVIVPGEIGHVFVVPVPIPRREREPCYAVVVRLGSTEAFGSCRERDAPARDAGIRICIGQSRYQRS